MRKLRAVFGTSAVGGALGTLLGLVMCGVGALIAPGEVTLWGASVATGLTGAFGFVSAGGFAAMLAMTRGAEALEDLSIPKSALFGFTAGAAVPVVFCLGALALGYSMYASEVATLASFFGVLGGATSAGIVSVAKASGQELVPGPRDSDERALSGGAGSTL